MSGTNESKGAPNADFDFGVRELDERERLRDEVLRREFEAAVQPAPAADECPGVDPYNTSGSFDRRHNWKRVSRR